MTKLIQQVVSLAVTLYVARLLGPKDFGVMAIAMALVVYLNSLTSFGMTGGIVNSDNIDNVQLNALFTLNILLSVLLVSGCIIFSVSIATVLKTPDIASIIPAMSLIIPLATFYNLPMALLRREMNFKLHSIIDFLQYIVVSALMLTLAISGLGIWALVYAQLCGYAVSAIALLVCSGWRPRFSLRFRRLKGLFDYGLWEMFRYNLNYVEGYASYYIVCSGINATFLGLYDRASSFASVPNRIMQVQINSVLFSAFSRMKNEGDRLIAAFKKGLAAYSLLVTPVMTVIALVSEQFVKLTLGEAWIGMVGPMQILCLACLLKMISGYFRNFSISCNNYKKQTLVDMIMVATNVTLCIIGVRYGIEGVSLGILIASALSMIVNIALVTKSKDIKIVIIIKMILPAFIGSALMAIIMLSVRYIAAESGSVVSLVIQLIVGSATYCLISIVSPFSFIREITTEVFADVRKILQKGY